MNTVPLNYDIDGTGPLLVAIHGITEDRRSWNRVPLSEHFRTIRVDLRGHGMSPRIPPYDPVTLATDVHELLVSTGQSEAAPLVVGHSYGGLVATTYASRFPVRGTVNIDQRLDASPLTENVARAIRGPGYEDFFLSWAEQLYGDLDPAAADEIRAIRQVRQDVLLGAWAPLLDLSAPELTSWMRNLWTPPNAMPYLSLHGSPIGDDYGPWLAGQIPTSQIGLATVRTHYPHLADPTWFIQRLLAFDAITPPTLPSPTMPAWGESAPT